MKIFNIIYAVINPGADQTSSQPGQNSQYEQTQSLSTERNDLVDPYVTWRTRSGSADYEQDHRQCGKHQADIAGVHHLEGMNGFHRTFSFQINRSTFLFNYGNKGSLKVPLKSPRKIKNR